MIKFSSLAILVLVIIISVTPCFAQNAVPTSHESIYEISGVPQPIHDNIINRLKAAETQSPEKAKQEILLAIQPFGYFHATMTYTHNQQGGKISFNYTIQLGPPLHIIKTEIIITGLGGNNQTIQTALKNNHLLQKGGIFTTEAYSKTQTLMFNLAHNHGYAKAEMTRHEVYINLEKNEASVYLTLDTGPLFYYGLISFSPSPYDTHFLKRFITFEEGQIYSPIAVQQLQENLINTPYFSSATVKSTIDQADTENSIPIKIDTQPVKSQQYNFGVGYGTNTGSRTSIGADLYRITDTGQYLSTLLNLSAVNTSITAKYHIPGPKPITDQYIIGAYLGEFRPDAGTAYTKKIFTGYETKSDNKWSTATYLNFLHERFSINNEPYHTTDMVYPSLNISRLATNNPINPDEGTRVTLDVAAGSPGSEEEFLQSELSGKWIYPATKNNFVMLRGDVGTTYAKDYSDNFPLSMRFFAGGYNSVRGYSYESLGPGKYLKIGSAEIQQRVYEQFYAGVFIDEGNASDNLTEPLERSIGLNFIYRTSVGPLSIYIAQANTEPGKPLSIEFNFGANL
jgi:translocation and assembly module TamA